MQTTKRDLRVTLQTLVDENPRLKGAQLQSWSHDGVTRYRLEQDGRTPLGCSYWLGASEAYHGLWVAIYAFRLARQEAVA